MDDHLADYKTALYEACKTVAEYEKRSLEQLFLVLLNPDADILKIRIEKKDGEPGNILLDDAIGVCENTKKLLGAAAQDVLKPAILHLGRMDTKISSFLSKCRFGQTEAGSVGISVICPMTEDDDGENRRLELFEDKTEETSFTRQITRKVFRNIQKLKSRIDDGQYNLAETSKENGISANFYDALLGMNLRQEGIRVDFMPEWAPCLKMEESLPQRISLTHHYYQLIHATVTQLKGNIRKYRKITGRIKRLEAAADIESRNAGKVSVVYVDDTNRAKTVVVTLDKDDYNRAIEAHTKGWYVEVIGAMRDGHSREIECESFNVI